MKSEGTKELEGKQLKETADRQAEMEALERTKAAEKAAELISRFSSEESELRPMFKRVNLETEKL